MDADDGKAGDSGVLGVVEMGGICNDGVNASRVGVIGTDERRVWVGDLGTGTISAVSITASASSEVIAAS